MDDTAKKVDESWKAQAAREKQAPAARPEAAAGGVIGAGTEPAREAGQEAPEARFDLFVSGLAMEALIALGEMPHPTTRKQAVHLPHAKYLIDLLGILEEKTKGNLAAEEEQLLKDALYQLRMRYLAKSGG